MMGHAVTFWVNGLMCPFSPEASSQYGEPSACIENGYKETRGRATAPRACETKRPQSTGIKAAWTLTEGHDKNESPQEYTWVRWQMLRENMAGTHMELTEWQDTLSVAFFSKVDQVPYLSHAPQPPLWRNTAIYLSSESAPWCHLTSDRTRIHALPSNQPSLSTRTWGKLGWDPINKSLKHWDAQAHCSMGHDQSFTCCRLCTGIGGFFSEPLRLTGQGMIIPFFLNFADCLLVNHRGEGEDLMIDFLIPKTVLIYKLHS